MISITGLFGVKPALFAAAFRLSATAAEGASPTAPHCSQIRNTTGASLGMIVDAGEERVAALDAMHEALRGEEIERAIDRDRRRARAARRDRSMIS